MLYDIALWCLKGFLVLAVLAVLIMDDWFKRKG